jgi:hypothetical protein
LKQKLKNVHASRQKNFKSFKPLKVESSTSDCSKRESISSLSSCIISTSEENNNGENQEGIEQDSDEMVVNKDETASRASVSSSSGSSKSTSSSLNKLAGLSSGSRSSAATSASSAKINDITSKISNSNNNNNNIYYIANNSSSGAVSSGSKSKNVPMSKELKKSLINELLSIVSFAKSQGKDYAKKIDSLKQEATDLNKKRADLSERDKIIK